MNSLINNAVLYLFGILKNKKNITKTPGSENIAYRWFFCPAADIKKFG